jgi:putative transposase
MGYKKHKQYRLPGYDYSSDGNYFITICTKNKDEFLGKVIKGKMILSPIGKITESTWKQIPGIFPNIILGAFQVMPDHFHAIITIKNSNIRRHLIKQMPTNQISTHQIPLNNENQIFKSGIKNNPMELKIISLGKIIRWFKGRVKYDAAKFNPCFHWQTRFYERIIRNKKGYFAIKNYIVNNPAKTIKNK